MGGNPFHDDVDELFVGRRVRVHAQTGVYEGWLQIREYNERAVLLLDATREDGTDVGEVVLNGVTAIERVDPETTVERVAVESLSPSPYTQRSFDTANFRQFVRLVRDRGGLGSFPLVRPVADGRFEIVSGHRRYEAARRAGLDAIPVRIAHLDDWAATVLFLDEHVPAGKAELRNASNRRSGFYEPAQLDALVERLREDWDERRLRDHAALGWYLEEASLGVSDPGDGDDDTVGDEADGDGSEDAGDGPNGSEVGRDTDPGD